MHSLLLMFPGFILSLSLFQFSIILHRFQTGFDLLTPSVIQRYVNYEIREGNLVFWFDPNTVITGIESYFDMQFSDERVFYSLDFKFFHSDQVNICQTECKGVLTTLQVHLEWSPISFSRQYQLVKQ